MALHLDHHQPVEHVSTFHHTAEPSSDQAREAGSSLVDLAFRCLTTLLCFVCLGLNAQVPERARSMIDRIIGSKGIYITDASVYNVTLPRPEATVVLNYQRMSVNHGLNSWVGFSAAKHNEAIATGQFLLLDDEVAAVITTALRSDLEITGLADSSFFEGPKIRTMNFTGVGTYEGLAMAFREVLETIEHTRWEEILHKTVSLPPTLPLESSITAGHLNSTLDLKGALQTVCTA